MALMPKPQILVRQYLPIAPTFEDFLCNLRLPCSLELKSVLLYFCVDIRCEVSLDLRLGCMQIYDDVTVHGKANIADLA